MGPIWGQQYPGGPHVGLMNLAIWVVITIVSSIPTPTQQFGCEGPSIHPSIRPAICPFVEGMVSGAFLGLLWHFSFKYHMHIPFVTILNPVYFGGALISH